MTFDPDTCYCGFVANPQECRDAGGCLMKECVKEGMTHGTCRYNPRLGCDCGFHEPDYLPCKNCKGMMYKQKHKINSYRCEACGETKRTEDE